MQTALIIPAFNEELTIREVITGFHKQRPEVLIYIIDNNSSDNTNKIAKETLAELGCKGDVLFEKRQGKANTLRMAFKEIEADVYIIVDADMTYLPEDLPVLLAPILKKEADMVVGDRHFTGEYSRQNRRPFHLFGNILVKRLINFFFKSKLNDIMSGYRVFNKRFVKNFPVLSKGFEVETEMTLHCLDKKFRIVEIPITYKNRPAGSKSKLNTFKDGFRVLRTIFWIFKDYKPLVFFSSLSALFCIAALLIGYPVVKEFYDTHYVSKVPSAILATGLMIFSLLSFAIGLILDTLAKFHRFDYELSLLRRWRKDE